MRILLRKYKKKIRKMSVPLVMFFISSTAQASCLKLAKIAGISQDKLNKIVNKLVKIESTTGKYNVKNHRSGAYGRYQIMPSTAKYYAEKLGIAKSKWKTPYNQDKIFKAIMRDNIKSLKRYDLVISAFSLYAAHQQGAGGFNAIMKNKPLSTRLEKNLRTNLPSHLKKVKKSRLRVTWINYWKEKLA
jgi:hypothetical protein